VAVGAAAAAAGYTAARAGTRRWSWNGFAKATTWGALGGLGWGGFARGAGKQGIHFAWKGVRRFGVSFTKKATARGSNFWWRRGGQYGNNFRLHKPAHLAGHPHRR
jgi:hypothetical protein